MGVLGSLCGWRLLDYKTEKYVLTRNWWVGALQRVLQLGILGYVIGWSLLLQKGYQEKDSDPRVSVITKLKGVSVAQMEALGSHVWDVADYTKPPQGENVFFLVTNFLATPEQVQGKCPEHPSVPLAPCLADEDCPAGETLSHSHGIKTGKCVPFNSSYQTCEIWGWCPVESGPVPRSARPAWPWGLPGHPPKPLLRGAPGSSPAGGRRPPDLSPCLGRGCRGWEGRPRPRPPWSRGPPPEGSPSCWSRRTSPSSSRTPSLSPSSTSSRKWGEKGVGLGGPLGPRGLIWGSSDTPELGLHVLVPGPLPAPTPPVLRALLGPPAPSSAAPPVWELGRILGSQAPVSAGLVPPSSRSPSDPLPSLRANTLETRDGGYFKRCRYHAQASPLCPVFRVGDVVAAAGGDFEDLALLGGVVRIQITWDCDLDRPGSECQPRYSFWLQEKGHNFRAAVRWWRPPGREARSLFKLFGIRFEILVAGQAGKFSVISTGITLGTGMALLGAATFLCDLLLLYVDRQAPFYWGEKYEEAKAPKGKGGPETPGRSRGPAGPVADEGGPEAGAT
ncbi:P2X purinoceptor 6 [Sarcophilus harrisii]